MIFIHTEDTKQHWYWDNRLSWKAKGIMSSIIGSTYPDEETGEPYNQNMDYFLSELLLEAKDGPSSLSSGIKELESNGYLKRSAKYNKELGKIEYKMEVMY